MDCFGTVNGHQAVQHGARPGLHKRGAARPKGAKTPQQEGAAYGGQAHPGVIVVIVEIIQA